MLAIFTVARVAAQHALTTTQLSWRNIDIRKKPSGEPFLVFSGPAKELAATRGVTFRANHT